MMFGDFDPLPSGNALAVGWPYASASGAYGDDAAARATERAARAAGDGDDGDDGGGGGRMSRPSQTPSHHAGAVRVPPLTPTYQNPYIYRCGAALKD